jgi:uncharacterized protein
MTDDQSEVIAFLSTSANYGISTPVERIDTHASIVFLAGDRAYKLKRSVAFSYLDYSSSALRRRACEREVALNRRTAPQLYLKVQAIGRRADGALGFDGDGPVLDWVVVMRRFDQADLFDRLAETDRLTPALLRDLADAIVEFHAAAEIRDEDGDFASWLAVIDGNDANLRLAAPELDSDAVGDLRRQSREALGRVADLLARRRGDGKVRQCHGDLHLRNICLVDGRPTLFDCVEFDDRLACVDVLYDIAFLWMDLSDRELDRASSVVFNRYLDLTGDVDGLPALPLFMSVRAAIRAHVAIASSRRQQAAEAAAGWAAKGRSYLALARGLLRPQPPCLVAIGGLSGSGKSTLAAELASAFSPAPGARVIRSDVIRKRLANVAPEQRLTPAAYTQATGDQVYRAMREEAAATLAAGFSAIVDATFLDPAERDAIAAVARPAEIPFIGLWLQAPPDRLARRIAERHGDASDADLAVLAEQLRRDASVVDWPGIDAAGDLAGSLAAAKGLIAAARPPAVLRPG